MFRCHIFACLLALCFISTESVSDQSTNRSVIHSNDFSSSSSSSSSSSTGHSFSSSSSTGPSVPMKFRYMPSQVIGPFVNSARAACWNGDDLMWVVAFLDSLQNRTRVQTWNIANSINGTIIPSSYTFPDTSIIQASPSRLGRLYTWNEQKSELDMLIMQSNQWIKLLNLSSTPTHFDFTSDSSQLVLAPGPSYSIQRLEIYQTSHFLMINSLDLSNYLTSFSFAYQYNPDLSFNFSHVITADVPFTADAVLVDDIGTIAMIDCGQSILYIQPTLAQTNYVSSSFQLNIPQSHPTDCARLFVGKSHAAFAVLAGSNIFTYQAVPIPVPPPTPAPAPFMHYVISSPLSLPSRWQQNGDFVVDYNRSSLMYYNDRGSLGLTNAIYRMDVSSGVELDALIIDARSLIYCKVSTVLNMIRIFLLNDVIVVYHIDDDGARARKLLRVNATTGECISARTIIKPPSSKSLSWRDLYAVDETRSRFVQIDFYESYPRDTCNITLMSITGDDVIATRHFPTYSMSGIQFDRISGDYFLMPNDYENQILQLSGENLTTIAYHSLPFPPPVHGGFNGWSWTFDRWGTYFTSDSYQFVISYPNDTSEVFAQNLYQVQFTWLANSELIMVGHDWKDQKPWLMSRLCPFNATNPSNSSCIFPSQSAGINKGFVIGSVFGAVGCVIIVVLVIIVCCRR